MKATDKNYKLRKFEFKPKHTPEDIEMIKSMKADGKEFADIYYVMLQRLTDPITKELSVHPSTISRWINQN